MPSEMETPDVDETLAALPATEHPASELTLKNTLLSLKRDLQLDLHMHLSKFQTQLEKIEERTDHIKRKMTEYTAAYNDLLDDHSAHTADITCIKDKLIV